MTPFFTIIIPVKATNDYVRETVPHIQALIGASWELIILPNEPDLDEWHDPRIQIVASGQVGPAKKRDMGATLARGEILVFLDDDSYPKIDLLEVAKPYFSDNNIVALGGPAITPPHDNFGQKVSGAVFLSKFSGGSPERYIPIGKVREVQDWPSVNLMVRKKDFVAIGGFNSPFWPGEDTKLCLDLINKTGKQILYIPNLIVWHHRRAGLLAHLKQVGGYGLHRGYFAKKYPQTSRKFNFFIPSAFLLFACVSVFFPWLPLLMQTLIVTGWSLYGVVMLLAFFDITKHEKFTVALVAIMYTFVTHLFYGLKFIQGLLTSNLVSRLR